MDRREISSLGLQKSHLQLLLRSGFRTIQDLRNLKPSDLARELGVSPLEAKAILDQSNILERGHEESSDSSGSVPTVRSVGKSAAEMYDEKRKCRPIITFCQPLDSLLGGGVHVGEIIEFCGVPGIGKTQLGMQLAVNVQIPEEFRGVDGECIYIDTEGSFMVERAQQISAEAVIHLHRVSKNPRQQEAAARIVNPNIFLKGIHLMRVHDHTEQLAAVANLPALVRENPRVRLVVIDSVAFHFRHGSSSVDFGKRTRLLSSMAQKLNELAHKQSIAVVLMNQMTTKVDFGGGGGGGSSRLVPALGESWAHAATHRVTLFWASPTRLSEEESDGKDVSSLQQPQRLAKIIKSNSRRQGAARFLVCHRGVRSAGNPSSSSCSSSSNPSFPSSFSSPSSSSSFPDDHVAYQGQIPIRRGEDGNNDDPAKRPRLDAPTL